MYVATDMKRVNTEIQFPPSHESIRRKAPKRKKNSDKLEEDCSKS